MAIPYHCSSPKTASRLLPRLYRFVRDLQYYCFGELKAFDRPDLTCVTCLLRPWMNEFERETGRLGRSYARHLEGRCARESNGEDGYG